ncbi:Phosphohydrolase Icc/MPP superfamily [Methanonatronarchaeum thermophilum]|uniref:Phosphohydrolase Icc/MPP superfamily n=1 Tax=Methanonatronarchaeum thermophilum TaxID=1927129 RepID=A0A1Y3GFI3_9EURY|nr:metallophosphoesterase [Methanonatronarchaeum thermophilum]OUJ18954.1 Phosphohydrolase Icc/MPP superfamily [Methanonatronarchaeum thermophilum]
MKMLVISDIHGKISKLEKVVDKVDEVDLVTVLGDITDFGPSQKAVEILKLLKTRFEVVIGVPGNCDPDEIKIVLDSQVESVDQDWVKKNGLFFVGIGGSNPTPFDTPRELEEDEIYEVLNNIFSKLEEGETVLISHSPPQKTVDLTSGVHAGSEGVRKIVEKFKPRLVLSGHIHEARGTAYVGETMVVNPGAIRDGNAAIVEINDEINVDFISD